MKLSLKADRDIHVLEVSGDLDAKGFSVLKAGITQLFKTGKNRIILELSRAKVLRPEPLRELASLNKLARELAGEILIAGAAADLIQDLRKAAGPEGIVITDDLAGAMRVLRPRLQPSAEDGGSPPDVARAAAGGASENAQVDRLQEELLALKKKLLEKESGGLSGLRRENAELKSQVDQLKALLERLVLERRAPQDEAAYQARIRSLEAQVEESMQKLAAADK